MTDTILEQMAGELKRALESVHADTSNPPVSSHPPARAAYAEYQRRGGTQYTNADVFVRDLVADVVRQSKEG
jgi:plasmid replication initiation protein